MDDITTDLTHEEAIANGVRLHYVEAGEGPLVLLLHGFPEFWYSWRNQIPALAAAGYRVVAPDMRGYNTSEKPLGVEQYDLGALVGDVRGLLDHLGAEKATVIGHNWGGVVAWETAIRHPELLTSLVVLNAPHRCAYRRELFRSAQLARSWYALLFQLPWLPELLFRAGDDALLEFMFRELSERPDAFTEADVCLYKEAVSRPGALTAMLNYYRALFRTEMRRTVRSPFGGTRPCRVSADVPTLLIWGERDLALSVRLTEGLDTWVPNLRVERLPDASHWVQNDRPERVNDLLVEFLDGTR